MKLAKMIGTTILVALFCTCGSAETMKTDGIVSDASISHGGLITSAAKQASNHKSTNGTMGRSVTTKVRALEQNAMPSRTTSMFADVDGESRTGPDTSIDPLLMGMALVGLIVLQLRRKQKTLPHRSLAPFCRDVESPTVARRKLELTLQS